MICRYSKIIDLPFCLCWTSLFFWGEGILPLSWGIAGMSTWLDNTFLSSALKINKKTQLLKVMSVPRNLNTCRGSVQGLAPTSLRVVCSYLALTPRNLKYSSSPALPPICKKLPGTLLACLYPLTPQPVPSSFQKQLLRVAGVFA